MNTLAIGLSLLSLLIPASFQAPASPEVASRVVAERPDPADRVAEEAYKLFADRGTWARAARMLEKSAAMRTDFDPARASAFSEAARVYFHVGQLDEARSAFEAAARAASARGSLVEAAHAYFDAATVAMLRGDTGEADDLIERGALLAESPHLNGAEKASLLRRLPENRVLSN